jgi:hypothetical protein
MLVGFLADYIPWERAFFELLPWYLNLFVAAVAISSSWGFYLARFGRVLDP